MSSLWRLVLKSTLFTLAPASDDLSILVHIISDILYIYYMYHHNVPDKQLFSEKIVTNSEENKYVRHVSNSPPVSLLVTCDTRQNRCRHANDITVCVTIINKMDNQCENCYELQSPGINVHVGII